MDLLRFHVCVTLTVMRRAAKGVLSTPDVSWLRQHAQRGYTQAKMVEAWEKESGIRVTRSAIAMAMMRHNVEPSRPRPRYEDTVPWKVRPEHRLHTDARLLRLEGRRRHGGKLSDADLHWLNVWRKELETANAVITYDPDTEEGFFWVPRTPQDDDIVRRPV